MRLYILRHAETEFNNKGIIQGSEVDSDINKTGLYQAKRFYEYYKNIDFEKVYTSNLKRTFQSVYSFIENGLPYEKLEEFNEISWGINQGKSDSINEYSSLINSWLEGNLDNKFENGESPNQMSIRLERGINKVISDGHNTVLLCIHGRALRILLSKIVDNDLTQMDKYIHSNTGLYILEYYKGKYKILESNLNVHLTT